MTENVLTLVIATTFFVASHFILASLPVRGFITQKFGESGHLGVFYRVSLGGLAWIVIAFSAARYDTTLLWQGPAILAMVPVLVMPIVTILLVCALTSRNPTAVGGEKFITDPKPQSGITTVTRHPMMVGVALWAASHLVANGDLASVVLFGGMLVLINGGKLHIDNSRRVNLKADWGPIALTTSIVPFWAALQGRTQVDWAGIGLWRVAAGLALYGVLVFGHPYFAGIPVMMH
ncbi:MAG: NnrU family protein [Alphaproteobacteria bacterium]|nr:NnrU family protein [Alphaproteobacteria bacterium]